MSLLDSIVATLQANQIRFAVIGAAAMAIHQVPRSSLDVDLLTTDPRAFNPEIWGGLKPDFRPGDELDPFAGMVRFREAGSPSVILMVGRSGWQRRAVERAEAARLESIDLPVVSVADLILLKLFARGSQDRSDIEKLLEANRDELVLPTVASEIHELPPPSRELWKSIVKG